MIHFWLLALRNLQRNLKRNIATGSAIAFGFAGILMLGAYVHRVQRYLETHTIFAAHTGHIAVFVRGGFENFNYRPKEHSFSRTQQEAIEAILKTDTNVDFFERQLWGSGLIGNGCLSLPFFARGLEPSVDERLAEQAPVREWLPDYRPFLKGRGLWNYPLELAPLALSGRLARGLGKLKVHDEITPAAMALVDCTASDARAGFTRDANVQLIGERWEGALGAADGEVVAHYTTGFDESDNSAMMAPLTLLQSLYETDAVGRYSIWLKDPTQRGPSLTRINESFSRVGLQTDLFSWDDFQLSPYYAGTMQFLFAMASFIAVVMTVVVVFSVLNSTTMTILERSEEIGTYRALGFRRRVVRELFVQESVWLSVISLLIGGVIGVMAIALVNRAGIIYHPPGVSEGMRLKLVLHPLFAVLTSVGMLVLTMFATWLSTLGRLREEPAKLLGGITR
jgi:putative ABC transport system permease protein